jgi:hypothetical protein
LQSQQGHLLLGEVDKVTAPFLGQWAIPVPSQRTRSLEKAIKHNRTSGVSGSAGGSTIAMKSYVVLNYWCG